MKTLGLTGGIGSGKSAVAARLAEKAGVRVVRADDVAKGLMASDPAVRAALLVRFGPATFGPDGELDRAGLAARVFGDPAEVAALNAIVHPAVRRAMVDEVARAPADCVRLLVFEAALLFEVGGDSLCDVVAVVDAPAEMRVSRVMARDGANREAVLARMAHQLPSEELRRRAHVVIENDGDLAHLHAQTDALYAGLVKGDE